MKNKVFLVLLAFFFFSGSQFLWAQKAPTIAWDKTFGGNNGDQISCMLATTDGGFLMGGSSFSGISGDKTQANKGHQDYWIVKIDAKGNKQWDKSFGGSQQDYLVVMKQTPDAGFILAGNSYSPAGGDKTYNANDEDWWVIKLDSSGNKVWDKTIGGSERDQVEDLQVTSNGGIILGGTSNSPVSGYKSEGNKGSSVTVDYWVVKLDPNGNKIWDKTIGGALQDDLECLQKTADGGFILSGQSGSGISGHKSQPSWGGSDFWVVKIDSVGHKEWDSTLGGDRDDYASKIDQLPDGGYILGGRSESGLNGDKTSAGQGMVDFWLLRLDQAGNKLWDKTYGTSQMDHLSIVQKMPDAGFLLGGYTNSNINGDKTEMARGASVDGWLLKLDAAGNKIWDKTIGGFEFEIPVSLVQLPGNELLLGIISDSYVSGDKTQPSKGSFDYWLVKLNAPCNNLTAKLTPECITGGTNLKVEVKGMQTVATQNSWTLTYSEDGITKSITDSVITSILAYNPAPGTVFNFISLTSGACTTNLNLSFTMPGFPVAPAVSSVKRCGPGSVTFTAAGAPAGNKYVWFKEPVGGSPLQTDTIGEFTTPELQEPTLYYVALKNALGCEGPRTQVLAELNYCLPVFIPNIVTQNHDGKNETFQPQNLAPGKWQLQIYNRWGNKIYETVDYKNTWPETEIAAGTYYYLLRSSEITQQFKGWVEVVK